MTSLEQSTSEYGKGLSEKIKTFSRNLDNLRDFVEVVGSVLDEKEKTDFEKDPESLLVHLLAFHELDAGVLPLSEKQIAKMRAICDGKYEITIEGEAPDGPRVKIKPVEGGIERLHIAAEVLVKSARRRVSLHNSALISLVSEGEWFCAQMIHYYFAKHPNAVGLKERNFSFDELIKFSTIEEARKYLIDNKVEDILRGNFNDWIDFFKEKIKIQIGFFDSHLPYAFEACLRRNLLVHNGGIVNKLYLNKLPEEITDRPEIDSQIAVDSNYFGDRIARFEVIFLILALELWGKLSRDDAGRGVMSIDLGFEALRKERYATAEALCRYGMNDRNLASDLRANAQVNYWQSLKWRGRLAEIQGDIEKWDVSAMDLSYKAAKCALLDQEKDGVDAIRVAIRGGRLSKDDLMQWPLFKEWRSKGLLSEFTDIASEGL